VAPAFASAKIGMLPKASHGCRASITPSAGDSASRRAASTWFRVADKRVRGQVPLGLRAGEVTELPLHSHAKSVGSEPHPYGRHEADDHARDRRMDSGGVDAGPGDDARRDVRELRAHAEPLHRESGGHPERADHQPRYFDASRIVERSFELEGADANTEPGTPELEVAARPGRVGPDERDGGGEQQDGSARSLDLKKALERPPRAPRQAHERRPGFRRRGRERIRRSFCG